MVKPKTAKIKTIRASCFVWEALIMRISKLIPVNKFLLKKSLMYCVFLFNFWNVVAKLFSRKIAFLC